MWIFEKVSWRPLKGSTSYDIQLIPGLTVHSCEHCTTVAVSWLFWSFSAGYLFSSSEDIVEEPELDVVGEGKATWLVPVSWIMYSDIAVDADTSEDAVKLLEEYRDKLKDTENLDSNIIHSGTYLENSLDIETDEEFITLKED